MKKELFLLAILVLAIYAIRPALTGFSGSHTINKNSTNNTGACVDCHAREVNSTLVSAHSNVGCICHGYSPNLSINIRHNLTKNIYCTNCHSNYDSQGKIVVHSSPEIVAMNQSAHYITNNTVTLQNHSYNYFNNS